MSEHYKAASERTDADERALIPPFKRTDNRPPTHVDMVHVEHRAKLAEQRLQENIDALKWTRDNEKILAYQRDQAKAHADKLAEALRPFAELLEYPNEVHANTMREFVVQIADIQKANKALAAYEAAQ